MKRSIAAIILILCMAAACFAGCANNQEQGGADNPVIIAPGSAQNDLGRTGDIWNEVITEVASVRSITADIELHSDMKLHTEELEAPVDVAISVEAHTEQINDPFEVYMKTTSTTFGASTTAEKYATEESGQKGVYEKGPYDSTWTQTTNTVSGIGIDLGKMAESLSKIEWTATRNGNLLTFTRELTAEDATILSEISINSFSGGSGEGTAVSVEGTNMSVVVDEDAKRVVRIDMDITVPMQAGMDMTQDADVSVTSATMSVIYEYDKLTDIDNPLLAGGMNDDPEGGNIERTGVWTDGKFTIDDVEYSDADTLQKYLDNGWTIAYDDLSEYTSPDVMMEARHYTGKSVELQKPEHGSGYDGATLYVALHNNSDEEKPIRDCVVYGVLIDNSFVNNAVSSPISFSMPCGVYNKMTEQTAVTFLGEPDDRYESAILAYKTLVYFDEYDKILELGIYSDGGLLTFEYTNYPD